MNNVEYLKLKLSLYQLDVECLNEQIADIDRVLSGSNDERLAIELSLNKLSLRTKLLYTRKKIVLILEKLTP